MEVYHNAVLQSWRNRGCHGATHQRKAQACQSASGSVKTLTIVELRDQEMGYCGESQISADVR